MKACEEQFEIINQFQAIIINYLRCACIKQMKNRVVYPKKLFHFLSCPLIQLLQDPVFYSILIIICQRHPTSQ